MGKATQKSSPASLGTKRSCPDCGTKFYDFNKEDVVCPKCESKVDINDTGTIARASEPKKKTKEIPEEALMESEDLVVEESSDDFESVDDLEDEEEDIVEDLEVEEEGEDF
jgi:uncharacterized protein (TIGR02300 family)